MSRYVELHITLGMELHIQTMDVQYLVIDCQTPYHMILGRPSLNTLEAMVSTPHLTFKFLVSDIEIEVVHIDQKEVKIS